MALDFDAIGADVAATVAAVSGVRGCVYPPPEQAPAQGPSCWVDLAAALDLGNLEIGIITVVITVATPRKGSYPDEYRLVLNTARAITVAFRANMMVAGEAAVVSDGAIAKPIGARYGEGEGNNIVACAVTLLLETEEETVNQLVL